MLNNLYFTRSQKGRQVNTPICGLESCFYSRKNGRKEKAEHWRAKVAGVVLFSVSAGVRQLISGSALGSLLAVLCMEPE